MRAGNLLKFFCLMMVLLAVGGCAQLAPRQVTLKSLLTEMTDTDAVARWPQPTSQVLQASSYDRKSVTPADPTDKGWFANGDQGNFLRTETDKQGRPEHVMLDVEGPGCLVRAWFTSRATSDTLRIYLDGAPEPVIQGTFQELFLDNTQFDRPLAIINGKEGKRMGGMNLHLPIPYAKRCKVTWTDNSPVKQSRYYNIEYRTYPQGTRVQTLSPAALKANRARLDRTARTLLDPPAADGQLTAIPITLAPGARASLDLPAGPAAVRQLELKLTPGSATERALRDTVVSISFDGNDTVWAPVGDFFGSGVGLNTLHNWYRQVEKDGSLSCRWVMPYRQSAKITLLNLGQQSLNASLSATTGKWRWDDRSLYFHASWRQQRAIPSDHFQDWNYITIKGRGVYLGDSLALFNPIGRWWGEGDEKIYQEGAPFPTHFGTGSEDYYGYAWCSPALFHGPYSNQARCDGPQGTQGHVTVSRVRGLDRIPFNNSLQFDIEVWNKADPPIALDYAATTYWYGAPGATCNRVPQPAEAAAPISQVK